MGDIMRPVPIEKLLGRVLEEYRKERSIFGVSKIVKLAGKAALPVFDGKIETPFGPAAGPNTQLAQNIIASYAAGARFFELKTVQKMDGRELAACVPKPCITAGDECYNCEWSTELTVEEAFEEYVKGWFVCKLIAVEFGLGDPDAFVFNMSVGYDLEGIQTEKIDRYIEGMKDASGTAIFKACREAALAALEKGQFERVDRASIESVTGCISDSITESTLHGCPPDEIERIATYLITEKGLNTFIKCNPTLLGYEFARKTLDDLGFDYVSFDEHHFVEDLQWQDAVPMFKRLQALCDERGLEFGVKLTNTFPVEVRAKELPSEEMYMSGRSLFPLTIELCRRISEEFDGALRISFSGGADFFNIREIVNAGIWPVTMATTVLKPGGYQRFSQIAGLFDDLKAERFSGVDPAKVAALAASSKTEAYYKKPIKPLPSRKREEALPVLDCFTSPCASGCPIHQDVPAYLRAMEKGQSEEALRIILEKNALPFITGTICPHTCADRCMRNYYEEGLHIREMKLAAARNAGDTVFGNIEAEDPCLWRRERGFADCAVPKKAAIIGAGPAGLAAASFLTKAGIPVKVFEKNDKAGGVPRYVIPSFRISEEAIEKDVALCSAYGAEFEFGREIRSIKELEGEGFTDYIIAAGAWAKGQNPLKEGENVDALEFLAEVKKDPDAFGDAHEIVVIGGGNTAMDVARAAKRLKNAEHVRLVYRRTRRYMPADEEELKMALEDGVEFMELLAPEKLADGELLCEVMKLGEPDESGRRSPCPTGEYTSIKADLLISAVGEQVDGMLYEAAGAALDRKGRPVTDEQMRTSVPHIYAAGDARRGPATVVKAIADAAAAACAIVAEAYGLDAEETREKLFGKYESANNWHDEDEALKRKGILCKDTKAVPDTRCLGCETICEVCTDVCPNRANVAIRVDGMEKPQILHIDGMCNECGNCAVFCPWNGRPFKDKFTLFGSYEDFADSDNPGFLPTTDPKLVRVRFGGKVMDVDVTDPGCGLYEPLRKMILAVYENYHYLL